MRLNNLINQKFNNTKIKMPAKQNYYDICEAEGNKDIKQMLLDYAAAYDKAKEFTVR